MLALVQIFGLRDGSGGGRILGHLLEAGARGPFLSIVTGTRPPPPQNVGEEVHLPLRPPALLPLEGTRLGGPLHRLDGVFGWAFERRLARLLRARGATAVHVLPHGSDFVHAHRVARRLGLPTFLTVHDDLAYNMAGSPRLARAQARLGEVWRESAGRFVISEPMGAEYDARYGARPWRMVTDGLDHVPDAPLERPARSLRVYFMGLLHLSYRPNFEDLLAGMARYAAAHPGADVRLTIRGGVPFSLPPVPFPVEVRGWGSPAEVAADMDGADALYLPLPFAAEHGPFVRYSLSTKMVTYLGAGLPVVFHGPADSAAARLLLPHGAALGVTAPGPDAVADALAAATPDVRRATAARALALARATFRIEQQRRTFWDVVGGALPAGPFV